jgi:hypothetical protein
MLEELRIQEAASRGLAMGPKFKMEEKSGP